MLTSAVLFGVFFCLIPPLFYPSCFHQLARVISRLADFAEKYADMPALGFTHYQ